MKRAIFIIGGTCRDAMHCVSTQHQININGRVFNNTFHTQKEKEVL